MFVDVTNFYQSKSTNSNYTSLTSTTILKTALFDILTLLHFQIEEYNARYITWYLDPIFRIENKQKIQYF